MTTPIEFFRFWIVEERTGKRRLTTYRLRTVAWLVAALALPSSSAPAASTALLQDSDYLPASQESNLTSAEARFVADRRKDSARVDVVNLNFAAFDSSVISLSLRGITVEFVGRKVTNPPMLEYGESNGGSAPLAYHTGFTWQGKRRGSGSADYATLSFEKQGLRYAIYGDIYLDGVSYRVMTAGAGSFRQVLVEAMPAGPFTEPPEMSGKKR